MLMRPCPIRRGASGFVQLAENTETGEIVAIKFLERGGNASQRVIARELLNHRECALHPNIVQLKVRHWFQSQLCLPTDRQHSTEQCSVRICCEVPYHCR